MFSQADELRESPAPGSVEIQHLVVVPVSQKPKPRKSLVPALGDNPLDKVCTHVAAAETPVHDHVFHEPYPAPLCRGKKRLDRGHVDAVVARDGDADKRRPPRI
jgi:hypothetical protein